MRDPEEIAAQLLDDAEPDPPEDPMGDEPSGVAPPWVQGDYEDNGQDDFYPAGDY